MGLCASWSQPSAHSRMPYRHLELIAATRGICCNYSSQAETYIRWNQIGVRPIPHVSPVGRGRQNRTDKQHLPIIVLILPSPNSYYVNIVWSCLCLSLPTCYLIVLVWLCHPIPDSMLVRQHRSREPSPHSELGNHSTQTLAYFAPPILHHDIADIPEFFKNVSF